MFPAKVWTWISPFRYVGTAARTLAKKLLLDQWAYDLNIIKHLNISIILYIAFAISSPIKRPEIKCSAKVFDLAAHLGRLLCLDVVDGGEGGPAGGVQGQAGGHLPDLLLLLDARSGQQSTWSTWSQSQPGGQLHLCPSTVQGDLHCYLQVLDQILFTPQQILEGSHFFATAKLFISPP